jgi:hypothetical protein
MNAGCPRPRGARWGAMFSWIMHRLERRSTGFVLACAALSVAAIGVVDFLTGPELRLFIFYWPAITLAAWYGGRAWGMGFVALAGAV